MGRKKAGHMVFMLIAASTLLSVMLLPTAEAQTNNVKQLAKSMTVTSVQDPRPGNQAYQLAIPLSPQASQLHTGTLTYTAGTSIVQDRCKPLREQINSVTTEIAHIDQCLSLPDRCTGRPPELVNRGRESARLNREKNQLIGFRKSLNALLKRCEALPEGPSIHN